MLPESRITTRARGLVPTVALPRAHLVAIAAEALGATGLLATIFPTLPVWLIAFAFIVVLTAVKLTSVKNFGEFEFWRSGHKKSAPRSCRARSSFA